MIELDEKDWQIIEMLQSNAKLTSKQIAKKTLIPVTTVHNRIKKMEENGVIKQYSIKLDKIKIGRPITAVIMATVTYDHTHKFSQEDVAAQLKKIPGVEDVLITTGETDLLLKASVESIEALNNLVTHKLRNINGIDKTKTLVVLKEA